MEIRQTIKRILNEGVKDKIIRLIKQIGIVDTARYVGGYSELKRLIGDYEIPQDVKIDAIYDFVSKNDDGVNLGDFKGPIPYKETSDGLPGIDTEYHQIEYLSTSRAYINVYGGYKGETDMGEYGVSYEGLPDKILEEIFEIALDDLI